MTASKHVDSTEQSTEQKAPVTFSKEQILTFKKFSTRRDLLSVKLDERQRYTMDQVEAMIRDFMTPKGKVK